MKKSSLIKKITFGLVLSFAMGGIAASLSLEKTPAKRVDAGTGPTYTITVTQASSGTSYSIFNWWGGANFDSDDGWDSFASTSGEFISAYHTNLNYATKVTVKIDFVSCDSTNSPSMYLVVDYTKQSGKKTLSKGQNTLTWNLPKDVATGTNIAFCFDYPNATSSGMNYLYFNGFTNDTPFITIETDEASRAVSISTTTGVKSVYLSETSTAKSGSASGTKFGDGKTVYGFAVLAEGYNAPSGWTLVDGTANTEGAKYRVGSIKVSSSATSISYTAPTIKTNSIARNGNGGTSGSNVTLTYGQSATVSALSRSGYTFTGWNTNASGTGTAYTTSLTAAQVNAILLGNVTTLYAQWSANKYSVTLNKNGGTGGSDAATATYDSAMPAINVPTKIGYVFEGYYDSNSGGTKYYNANGTSARTWNKTSNATLYARWSYNSDIQSVIDLINAIGGPSNVKYPDSKDKIDAARIAYDALSDDYKAVIANDYGATLTLDENKYAELRNAVVSDINTKIDAIGTVEDVSYPASHDTLIAAEEAYARLLDEDKSLISDTRTQLLEEARTEYNSQRDDAINAVINAINLITKDEEGKIVYPDSKSSIESARELFEALAAEEKTSETPVTNYVDLLQAESDYQNLLEETVNSVIDAIDAIEKPFSDNRKQQISNAQALFNALDESEKSELFVTNIEKLEDAKAAGHVADMIEAIPFASDTNEYRQYVGSVREAYDSLTYSQQEYMPASLALYDSLLENEEAIAVMDAINAIEDVTYTSESNILINNAQALYNAYILKGYDPALIANYTKLTQAHTDYDNVDAVVNQINGLGAVEYSETFHDKFISARDNYTNLSDYQKSIFPESVLKILESDEKAYEAMDLIAKLAPMVNTPEHKALIETARAYLDNLQTNYPDAYALVSADKIAMLEDYEAAQVVINMINEISEPAYSQEYKDKMDAAETAYQALSSDVRRDLVVNYSTLTRAEEVYANVDETVKLIDAIGDVKYGGEDDSKEAIDTARAAYDALTAEEKALVNNYEVLTHAEEVYANVDETVKLIDAIGDVKYGGEDDSKEVIDTARAAYNALSEEEKALVDGYNHSTKTLTDDEAVYEAMALIDEIGSVGYDTRSEDAINEAREIYDSLTDDQKEQLGQDYLDVLVKSETEYATLKKNADILVLILLITVCLTIIGGAFFLFFIIKRRKDDDDENKGNQNKEPVKAMSVGGLIPLAILTSHYVDAPWLAFYILCGVALLLWIAILVLVIMKKKQVGPFKKKAPVVEIKQEVSSNEDDEEVINVADEKGNKFQIRYIKSFTAKLIQSNEESKKYYEELKNYTLSYKEVNSRVSWHHDSINAGRKSFIKFGIRGKTLCVYYPLDAQKVGEKYKVEKIESKRYESVPCMYRINNDRRLNYAKELIDRVARLLGLEKGEEQHESYANLPYEENKPLIVRGLIKELKVQVNKLTEPVVLETKVENKPEVLHSIDVEHADQMMSDEKAESSIEEDVIHHHRKGKKEIINIDTLSQNFNDDDEITLDSLIEKKLVSPKTGCVKVLARGTLDKRLIVDLDDFSLQAVKMIVLLGGHAKKIK